jgi:hypothetical protein
MGPNKVLIWLSRNQLRIEGILVTLSIASFFLKYTRVEGGSQALMISMMTLAVFYFLSAYTISDAKEYLIIVAMKVVGIASAVCVIGVTFSLLHLQGSDQMLLIGLTSISAAGLILFFGWLKSRNDSYMPLIARTVFLGFVSGLAMNNLLM